MRNKDFRRMQSARVIKKRAAIIENCWSQKESSHPLLAQPGRLDKFNLSCRCASCRAAKNRGNSLRYMKADEVILLKVHQTEIQQFLR